jgi:hypothetical protein
MADDSQIVTKLLRLRSQVAAANVVTRLRLLAEAVKYNPNQPRVPAGSPEGGQWTSEGAGSPSGEGRPSGASTVAAVYADGGQVLSDASPDRLLTNEQYAQVNNAPTGDSTIDEKTDRLLKTLAYASDSMPTATGPGHGIAVHFEFAKLVRAQNIPGVSVEQSFNAGSVVRYGLDDSIRTDVVLRNEQGDIVAIYDVKVNTATLRHSRAGELRAKTGARYNIPVIELHVRRGATVKREGHFGLSLVSGNEHVAGGPRPF